ncbi:MAG: DUF3179 domain-containing protein [Bacteroidetes bacterium]|nr:DUF3179 domain-containing protein [Bacteroidota bacterium]
MKRIAAALTLKPAFAFSEKLPVYVKRLILFTAIILLFSAEILRVYFLMPFPGSQVSNTVSYAYWIDHSIVWIRILALLLLCFALISVFRNGRTWKKILLSFILILYAIVFFSFNFRLQADKIFYQPVNKSFANATLGNIDKSKLIIGVVINGQAKAYPIQLIGYHHQVMDTIGKTPVMITYCTVCRTGRVYSPIVNGKQESFRLVGMDHFNAVFEDATTKSWWQQATGTAITGPLKGYVLTEFPSSQLTLTSWLRQYPNSLVMKPDTIFMDNYFRLEDYDKGTMQSSLVRRDTVSWQNNSWIVGVMNNFSTKAYDWNELLQKKIIQDSVDKLPILLAIENDTASFHVYDRRVDGSVLSFQIGGNNDLLVDESTHSSWNMDGICIAGSLKGKKLLPVQSYNEFWHSWRNFHKNSKIYVSNYTSMK